MKYEMSVDEINKAANFTASAGAFLIAAGVVGVSVCWGGWLFFWASTLVVGMVWHWAGIEGLRIACKIERSQPTAEKLADDIKEFLASPGDKIEIAITPAKPGAKQ